MKISVKNFEKYFDSAIFFLAIALLILMILSALAVHNSPIDYQQSNAVKIMYIHVPAAWMSLLIYTVMAVFNLAGFVWKNPFFYLISRSIASVGAVFAFITLVTGSIWGKPIWGTWFVFDPRLTSMLILFFLYLGYIAVVNSIDDRIKAEKIAAVISIVGFINIPIIKFSVEFWNSLHQPASILRFGGSAFGKTSIDLSMLKPLLLMAVCYFLYFLIMMAVNMKSELLRNRIERFEKILEQ